MDQKTNFHKSESASLFFGGSGDLSEHFRGGKVNLQITSQNFLKFPGLVCNLYQQFGVADPIFISVQYTVEKPRGRGL